MRGEAQRELALRQLAAPPAFTSVLFFCDVQLAAS